MDGSISGIYKLERGTKLPRPLFSVSAPVGFPSPASDYIEGRIYLNRDLILHPFHTYYARVDGDSMLDAGIPDGSYAAFDTHIGCGDKDIVIACINDELCIKTLREEGGRVWLEPANEVHSPIEITEEMDFRVLGCVTFVFHWVANSHVPHFRLSRCR